eukprot:CAMPEP_0170077088 /NCGR_PEP_ID=MMETSP0019_2-20121128/13976_1 /TAXON_ID=98059 /ORGANISM="Dinobryon sp., Strain UTEXLB2267" /LENGTH=669 /DNA_ID=CAMNT_0010289209 /DNA_START=322 /DNA_END=2331 /DNA_ORIENTATION=+
MAFGRLSEMIGNKSIPVDHMIRLLDIPRLSQEDFDNLDDEDREDLIAYAAGVNKYFQEVNYYLPHCAATYRNIKLDPWEPIHSIAILRLLAYEWSSGWESKLLSFQLATKFPNKKNIANTPASTEEGMVVLESLRGTAIAIAGFKSSSQSSLLGSSFSTLVSAGDELYQDDNSFPDVSGASVPGIPYVWMGRNPHISWSLTPAAHSDAENLFNSSDQSPLIVRERVEFIASSESVNPIRVTLRQTDYGPFLADILSGAAIHFNQAPSSMKNIVLCSQALRHRVNLKFLREVNRAENWQQFLAASQHMLVMPLHVLYSDINGSVGHATTGRALSEDEDIATSNIKWLYVSQRESSAVKHSWNPPGGLIVSIPSHLQPLPSQDHSCPSTAALPPRWRHTLALPLLSPLDVSELLSDVYSPSGDTLMHWIRSSLAANSSSSAGNAAVISPKRRADIALALDGFAGDYSLQAVAPVLIETVRSELLRRLAWEVGGLAADFIMGANPSPIKRYLVDARSDIDLILDLFAANSLLLNATNGAGVVPEPSELFLQALAEACVWLEEKFGQKWPSRVTWAQLHHVTRTSPTNTVKLVEAVLARGPSAVSGGLDTVFLSEYVRGSPAIDSVETAFLSDDEAYSTSYRMVIQGNQSARNNEIVWTSTSVGRCDMPCCSP